MFMIDLYDAWVLGIGDVFALAGSTGYEGQPGNQGGGNNNNNNNNNNGNGSNGYEGQPGNQGG